jgi:hypothetical protein
MFTPQSFSEKHHFLWFVYKIQFLMLQYIHETFFLYFYTSHQKYSFFGETLCANIEYLGIYAKFCLIF